MPSNVIMQMAYYNLSCYINHSRIQEGTGAKYLELKELHNES